MNLTSVCIIQNGNAIFNEILLIQRRKSNQKSQINEK